MATFSSAFLGCKISHTDAQELRERLIAEGHVERQGAVDVAVVNTCCVTHEAVRKSRQQARRAARRARRVFVTGCAANLEGAFDGLPASVEVVRLPSEQAVGSVAGAVGALGCVQADVGLERVRAFVKIQDGCSFSCSFCVIPHVRGSSRSRAAGAVLGEVARRVGQGHREIVLTGVNLGCYRDREAGFDLPRLVREAGSVPGVERLRLSSIEVNHLSDALVAAMRETPTVSPHLHVPLQSGDDGVLRAMGRRYDVATYLRRIEKAAGFNLTTDVIVGFPSEDEAAFENTLRAVEEAGVDEGARVPVLAEAGDSNSGRRSRSARCEEGAEHEAPRPLRRSLPAAVGREARQRRNRPRRQAGPRLRRRLFAVARRGAAG